MNDLRQNELNAVILQIKQNVIDAQIKVTRAVNNELIMLYFKIGRILDENSAYGNGFIDKVAMRIKTDFPNAKGFSERNLKRMKRFYNEYKEYEKVPQAVAQLSWSQNVILFEKIKDKNVRLLYAKESIKNGWSRSFLETQIELHYHERIGRSANNFNMVMPTEKSQLAEKIII